MHFSSVFFSSQYSNYNSALDYFSKLPRYRIQAEEIARQEGLFGSDTSKKGRSKKTISKQEEEMIIRQIIEQKMDIKGGFEKPSKTKKNDIYQAVDTLKNKCSSCIRRYPTNSLVTIVFISLLFISQSKMVHSLGL